MNVFLLIWHHRHGEEVYVYATKEMALEQRDDLVKTYWHDEVDDMNREEFETADEAYEYYSNCSSESMEISEQEVIGLTPDILRKAYDEVVDEMLKEADKVGGHAGPV